MITVITILVISYKTFCFALHFLCSRSNTQQTPTTKPFSLKQVGVGPGLIHNDIKNPKQVGKNAMPNHIDINRTKAWQHYNMGNRTKESNNNACCHNCNRKKQSISVNETDQYLQARSILIMTSNKERDSEGP
jgi:hypothetical protein